MASGTGDKLKGVGNDIKGRTKEAVADLTDRDDVRAEGEMDRAHGKSQQAKGKVKHAMDKVGDKVEDAADKVRGKK